MHEESQFGREYAAYAEELEHYYAGYPTDITAQLAELDRRDAAEPGRSSVLRKALIYQVAADMCDVHIFRHSPFYFEVAGGRPRDMWGFAGIGGWLRGRNKAYAAAFSAWKGPYMESGLLVANDYVDFDHQCIGYDNVLAQGLLGIRAHTVHRLGHATTDRERDYLTAVIIAQDALITIAERFAARAQAMAEDETDPIVRARLKRVADAAAHVPAQPPVTFYEALNTLIFMREASSSLEGIGVSTFGHLDRMLLPYYAADLAAGRLTREEAKELLAWFLAYTDLRWGASPQQETSTTVMIGGCDRDGMPIFNEITRLILEVYGELHLANPKLNARVSPEHPEEFLRLLADLTVRAKNVLAVFNDPLLIAAKAAQGRRLEDCRLYAAGGCQESHLQNSEAAGPAYLYLNLPQVLLMTLRPEAADFWAREGIAPAAIGEGFDGLYHAVLANLGAVIGRLIGECNIHEAHWGEHNPCPLHAATLDDCIERARDMTEGGARYNTNRICLVGIGTLLDALLALQEVVYTQGRLSLAEFAAVCAAGFESEEYLRQYLLHRAPKYGSGDATANALAMRVTADIAALFRPHRNARGGGWEPALFAYRAHAWMGRKTDATPDGRLPGEPLSMGMSATDIAVQRGAGISDTLGALPAMNLEAYPTACVLDMTLPYTPGALGTEAVVQIIRAFLARRGSVLQMNVADGTALRDAMAHPDHHADLMVRICGYSARFVTLANDIQEELVRRAEVAHGV